MSGYRTLPVPDGLDGMRVDAGLAKLLGLSRTAVAALTESGDVVLDGQPAGKSDRLVAGMTLEVTLPAPPQPVQVVGLVPGLAPEPSQVSQDRVEGTVISTSALA